MNISIIIPTYNRLESVKLVITSYLKQDCCEIIFIDDCSTDETYNYLKSLNDCRIITYKNKVRMGQQRCRKIGVKLSRYPWIFFGEDDVLLEDNYVSVLYNEAKLYQASAIAGRLIALYADNINAINNNLLKINYCITNENIFDEVHFEGLFDKLIPKPILAPYLHSIALINKNCFKNAMFSEIYKGNSWREETDFYITLNELNKKVIFTPSAICYHLRGPWCLVGGNRINRLYFEYYAFVNTYILYKRKWNYLKKRLHLSGTPFTNTIKFYLRRQINQLTRILNTYRIFS